MPKPPPMGHNGFSFETRDDLPADLPRLHFAKIFLRDALDDVLRLPNEERGFYLTALLVMYKEMEGLPADDKQAAMSMLLDVRQYRHLKAKVVKRGLLYERPTGRISNHRFEAEICAYVTEYRRRQDAAIQREEQKRSRRHRGDLSETSRRSLDDLSEISRTSRRDAGGDFSENPNENNEGTTRERAQRDQSSAVRARVLESESRKKEEERTQNKPSPSESEAARGMIDEGGRAPRWMLHPDGSYSGTAWEHFTADEVAEMAAKWRHLDFPQVLAECDDFLAPEFTQHRIPFDHPTRRKRLDGLLTSKNARAKAIADQVTGKAASPPPAVPAGPIAEGMAIAEDGSIALSNGVRQQWLDRFGGDENLLDLSLVAAVGRLRANSPTPLAAQINSILAGDCRDILVRQKNTVVAVERREKLQRKETVTPDGKTETQSERMRRIASEYEAEKARGAGR